MKLSLNILYIIYAHFNRFSLH